MTPTVARGAALSRREADDAGGEHVIDFAICLILAVAVVGLLLQGL